MLSVTDLPTPPSGSRIVFFVDQDGGLQLKWSLRTSSDTRRFDIVVLGCFLIVFYPATLFIVIGFVRNLERVKWVALMVIPWVFVIAQVTRSFLLLIKPTSPESILLSSDTIVYDPGCYHMSIHNYRRGDFCPPLGVLGQQVRPILTARRVEVRTIRLENSEGRRRLILDVDHDSVELGKVLNKRENEWLCTVLQGWLQTSRDGKGDASRDASHFFLEP
jgi:hypothetical protein